MRVISLSQHLVQRSACGRFLVQSMILTVVIAVKCGQDDVQSHYKIVWLLCLFQRLLVGRQVLALASQLSAAYKRTTCLESRCNVFFCCHAAQTTNMYSRKKLQARATLPIWMESGVKKNKELKDDYEQVNRRGHCTSK